MTDALEVFFRGLEKQSFILLFLVVATGYAVGRWKVKGVGLGATASTLIVGLALSLWAAQGYGIKFQIPEFASSIFFNLFMFSVGMKVGPQFLSGLRRDAGKFVFLAFFIPLAAFALILAVRAVFTFEPGLATGIMAGSNTATPGLGAARTAIGAATLPQGTSVEDATSNMSTAFALAYCISMTLFILSMKLPDLLGRGTAEAAREFEASLRRAAPLPGSAEEFFGGPLPVTLRAYELERPGPVGHPLSEIRRAYPQVSIERILRGGEILVPNDDLVLQAHDAVTIYGQVPRVIAAGERIGREVTDAQSRDVARQTVDIVVDKKTAIGRALQDLASDAGHGLYLNAMFRGGEAYPATPDTRVRKGDVLRVTGGTWRTSILEREIGTVVRASLSTDVVTLAVGLLLGALLGLVSVRIGGARITLGTSVGLLLVGIALSTLRTYNPALGGPFPEAARQLVEDLGLNVFIAILGINSGAGVVRAISGGALLPIIVGTLVVGFVPAFVAFWIGRRLLHMNLALLMGAVAGGRCNSAGMRAASEASQSTIPAISYPVTFAIANVLLTLLCYGMAMFVP